MSQLSSGPGQIADTEAWLAGALTQSRLLVRWGRGLFMAGWGGALLLVLWLTFGRVAADGVPDRDSVRGEHLALLVLIFTPFVIGLATYWMYLRRERVMAPPLAASLGLDLAFGDLDGPMYDGLPTSPSLLRRYGCSALLTPQDPHDRSRMGRVEVHTKSVRFQGVFIRLPLAAPVPVLQTAPLRLTSATRWHKDKITPEGLDHIEDFPLDGVDYGMWGATGERPPQALRQEMQALVRRMAEAGRLPLRCAGTNESWFWMLLEVPGKRPFEFGGPWCAVAEHDQRVQENHSLLTLLAVAGQALHAHADKGGRQAALRPG